MKFVIYEIYYLIFVFLKIIFYFLIFYIDITKYT